MFASFVAPRVAAIEYPWKGLIAQAAEAKNTTINGTLGVFLDDELNIGILPSMQDRVDLPAELITAYAPSHGVKALREAWKKRMADNGHIQHADLSRASLPVVTPGITSGLALAGHLLLEPGESELILPAPFWPNYRLIFERIGGARLRTYDLFANSNQSVGASPSEKSSLELNLNGLAEALSASHATVNPKRPLALLLNLPHNPTGYTYTENEAKRLLTLVQDFLDEHPNRRLTVFVDDAYLGFNYAPECLPHSLLRHFANAHDRLLCVHLSGATKEVYAWGLRVGFVLFAGRAATQEDLTLLEDKTAALVRGTLSNVTLVSQHLTLEALSDPRTLDQHKKYTAMLTKRYLACQEALQDSRVQTFFEVLPFNSGYFFTLQIKDPSLDAHALRKELLVKRNIGVVSLDDRLIRVAFSSIPAPRIGELIEGLVTACVSLKGAA
jgi:aspartate/methionine/tyrosine aminotransferase